MGKTKVITPIHIAIVDDDDVLRENIKEYLNSQDYFHCVIGANSMENFLYDVRFTPPLDVILLDIGLPGMSGISGIKLIKNLYPDINIVILTIHDDANIIFKALRAGASGYLLKSTPFSHLNAFIEMLFRGGAPMSHQIAFKVIQYFQPDKKTTKKPLLSMREKEVVLGLVDGLSYKEIAHRLCISNGTIHTHIRNIYRKLHVHSKVEVVMKSLRNEI